MGGGRGFYQFCITIDLSELDLSLGQSLVLGTRRLFHEVQIRGGRSLEGGYGLDLQERVWICVL